MFTDWIRLSYRCSVVFFEFLASKAVLIILRAGGGNRHFSHVLQGNRRLAGNHSSTPGPDIQPECIPNTLKCGLNCTVDFKRASAWGILLE